MSGSLPSSLVNDDLIPFDEFVAKLNTSPRTGRRIIASGKIGVVRIGAAVRIPAAELARFLKAQLIENKPTANIAGQYTQVDISLAVPKYDEIDCSPAVSVHVPQGEDDEGV